MILSRATELMDGPNLGKGSVMAQQPRLLAASSCLARRSRQARAYLARLPILWRILAALVLVLACALTPVLWGQAPNLGSRPQGSSAGFGRIEEFAPAS